MGARVVGSVQCILDDALVALLAGEQNFLASLGHA
jgi:hypothetical protein